MKQKSGGYTNCNGCSWYSYQRISTRTGELGDKRTNEDYPNYSITETGKNTEKSAGDLRRLAVSSGEPSGKVDVENDSHKLLWDFNIQTDHLIPARRPDLIIINKKKKKKKRTCKIVDFAIPADHRIKLKECEKKDKYLDLASELKKLWNMQVTIIPIVIGAFGTVTKGLLKGLEDLEVGGRVETIQTTALLRTARVLRRVLET